jgi:hypothetical protein
MTERMTKMTGGMTEEMIDIEEITGMTESRTYR